MSEATEGAKRNFWDRFLVGVGTEPRPVPNVRGASGIEHPVLAVGVDDKARRIVLVTEEFNARNAALMQADVQATIAAKVIVARTITADVGQVVAAMLREFGSIENFFKTDEKDTQKPSERSQKFLDANLGMVKPFFESGNLGRVNQVISLLYQFGVVEMVRDGVDSNASPFFFNGLDLSKLLTGDAAAMDRAFGVCPLLLTDFSPEDVEIINSASGPEVVRDVLSRLGIGQYFYPPPDQAALALVDRGVRDPGHVQDLVGRARELGHPHGPSEIVEAKVIDIVDALQERGLVIEGEMGMEMTEAGRIVRQTVKFRSREGLVSKLINRLEVKINLKDLLK
ncbi:hypothetical protein [Desertibaculum subflavum]|uniref:hypothetical protein n=1 Tax=Desertibaculum subflavum TaxID=2268458 RepID=UPI0013C3F31B